MELSIFRFHRWWFQTAGKGEERARCLGDCCSASQPGGSRLRRPSIVVRRMETFTQPDSILPARSWWLISIFWINLKESVVFFCQIKNYFPPFECLRGLFSNSNCSRPRRWRTVMGLMNRGSFDLIRPLCPLVSCRKFCSLCRKRRRAKTFFFFF